MKSTRNDWIIGIGFIIEIFLFLFSGFFLAYESLLGIALFFVGLFVALFVGKKIEQRAKLNIK